MEVRHDVAGTGVRLAVLVEGPVGAFDTPVESAPAGRIAAGEGIFLFAEVSAHRVGHDIRIKRGIIRRTVPQDTALDAVGIADLAAHGRKRIQPHQGSDIELPFAEAGSFLAEDGRGLRPVVPGSRRTGIAGIRAEKIRGGALALAHPHFFSAGITALNGRKAVRGGQQQGKRYKEGCHHLRTVSLSSTTWSSSRMFTAVAGVP